MVTAHTNDPAGLLKLLKALVQKDKIRTWTVDSDGDFWHDAAQVRGKCYFSPVVDEKALRFYFKWAKDVAPDAEVKAELHGHAVRMLMLHDEQMAPSIEVTRPKS